MLVTERKNRSREDPEVGAPQKELQRVSRQDPGCGVRLATLTGISRSGQPLVCLSTRESGVPVEARTSVRLDRGHVGRQVVLASEGDNVGAPIVIGVIEAPRIEQDAQICALRDQPDGGVTLTVDGKRLVLSAQEEIVLRCGAASITLTKAGKVIVRGHYVSSHASGVNRIIGGSIELN